MSKWGTIAAIVLIVVVLIVVFTLSGCPKEPVVEEPMYEPPPEPAEVEEEPAEVEEEPAEVEEEPAGEAEEGGGLEDAPAEAPPG